MTEAKKPPGRRADVVNLRRARKAKARTEKEKTATANRAAFGRTKAEKTASKAETERARRDIDGKRLTDD